MEKGNNHWTKWISRFVFAVLLIIIYKSLDNYADIKLSINSSLRIISPFLTGIFISYLLYTPCKKLEILYGNSKVKFLVNNSRGLSVLSTYLILVLIIVLVIIFAIPVLYSSAVDLVNNVPIYYNSVIKIIENIPQDSMLNNFNIKEGLIDFFDIYIEDYVNMESIGKYVKSILSFFTNIFKSFISIAVSIYILLDRKSILRFLSELSDAILKKSIYKAVKKYFKQINEIFFKFIVSKCLDSIINMIVVTTILLILKVNYGLLLGIIAGVFNLIPFFGTLIICGVIIFITILTGNTSQIIVVTILLILFQQIDANIIEPKIMNNSLKISPILVISGVMIGGAYFGVIGMFLAVPVITVFKILITDFIDYRKKIK